jgi:DNA replication protein DnaC
MSYQCPTCGFVPPISWGQGWYARGLCACRRRAIEEQEAAQVRQQMAALRQQQLAASVYGWLGKQWRQEGLCEKSFDTFDWQRQPAGYSQAASFANEPKGVLYLFGAYGVGKTHLLAAIANRRCELGQAVLFASVVTLFDAIQDRIRHEQDYHDLLRRAIATPLLILDDLDKPKPSEFRQEMLYQIVDGRNRVSLPLALSCNCPPAELDRFIGGAARSRLMQGMVSVEMTGPDYRSSEKGAGQ